MLPSDAQDRKDTPITSGVLDYFPDAVAEIARVSKKGNDQHNPGQPLHWAKEKSTDHADCIVRHLLERGTIDTDGMRHSAKVAWRALALLQTELEEESDAAEPVYSETVTVQAYGTGETYELPLIPHWENGSEGAHYQHDGCCELDGTTAAPNDDMSPAQHLGRTLGGYAGRAPRYKRTDKMTGAEHYDPRTEDCG